MHLDFALDPSPFVTALDRLRRGYPAAVRSAFEEFSNRQALTVKGRLPPLHRALAKSVIPRIMGPGARPEAHIGSPLPQARIVHFGGVITTLESRGLTPTPDQARRRVFGMKPIKYLTVPLTHAPFNTPKYARARDYSNLFVLKSKRGKLYLAQRAHTEMTPGGRKRTAFGGRNNKKSQLGTPAQRQAGIRLLFALVERATIKPFPYLFWSPADTAYAQRVLTRHLSSLAG